MAEESRFRVMAITDRTAWHPYTHARKAARGHPPLRLVIVLETAMSAPASRGNQAAQMTRRDRASAFHRMLGPVKGIAQAWSTYRDLIALEGADPRMLRDMGLTHGEVRGALAGPWWSRGTRDLIAATTSRRVTAIVVAGRR